MQTTTKPRTQPAPNPLPTLWARAIANHLHKNLTKHGWRTAKQLRAWNPTGAPRTGGHSTARGVPGPAGGGTTDLLTVDVYQWGIIDPETTRLPMPPVAWLARQLHTAGALTSAEQTDLNLWQEMHKHQLAPTLFTPQLNRHGVLTLRRNARAEVPEAISAAFEKMAHTTTVLTLNPDDLDAAHAEAAEISLQNVINALGV